MEIDEFIEKFVKDDFPRLRGNDLLQLMGSSYLFLDENNIIQTSELTDKVLKNLKKYLISARSETDLAEVVPVNSEFTEDEILTFYNTQSELVPHQIKEIEDEWLKNINESQIGDRSISQDMEASSEALESERVHLKNLLPPVLCEAFHRNLDPSVQVRWTAGFEDQSLKILFWRALMRYKWNNK